MIQSLLQMELKIMNKKDVYLTATILAISFLGLLCVDIFKHGGSEVVVYYKNNIILNVPISQDEIYKVNGTLGDVTIEVNNNKVRVNEETSPRHLCSNQGWISKTYETIICLPNEIIIKIEGSNSLDGVVK